MVYVRTCLYSAMWSTLVRTLRTMQTVRNMAMKDPATMPMTMIIVADMPLRNGAGSSSVTRQAGSPELHSLGSGVGVFHFGSYPVSDWA